MYVCDYVPGGTHVVHVIFEAKRTGGTVGSVTEGADTRPIRGVEFVKLADLPSLGFTDKFGQLASAEFPGAGSSDRLGHRAREAPSSVGPPGRRGHLVSGPVAIAGSYVGANTE